MTRVKPPVVGVLANRALDGSLPTQAVDEKYLRALIDVAGVSVVVIPALGAGSHLGDILDRIEGLVLTGAVSNVHPEHFAPDSDADLHQPFDTGRDEAALELIRMALDRDIPLLAICRGMQELNVCRGGSLTPNIFAGERRADHRPWDKNSPSDQLYAAVHAIVPTDGGHFERLTDGIVPIVNSVHVQAVNRLGEGLNIEAVAPDGTIEAISVPKNRFAVGVQWHPEYQAADNTLSRRLFEMFGEAVRTFGTQKGHSAFLLGTGGASL